ncbi:MAG TPA: hypothetical protein VJ943_07950, partial [Desulfotignum sp.]|nr:hypothetical protein [Desulfotignum sp.]
MTISAVQIASSRMTVVKEKGQTPALSGLENNRMVQARVLQVLPPDQARLLINGQKISVNTRVPLHAGEEIHLKVQAQKDGYILRLTGPPLSGGTVKPDLLLQFFSRPDVLSTLFKTDQPLVSDILEKLALQSSRRDDAFLPRLMDKGGLLLEKKLTAVLQQQDPASANRVTVSQMQGGQVKGSQMQGGQVMGQQGQVLSEHQVAKLLDSVMAEDFKGAVLKQALSQGTGIEAKSSGAAGLLQTLESLQLLNTQSGESGRYI